MKMQNPMLSNYIPSFEFLQWKCPFKSLTFHSTSTFNLVILRMLSKITGKSESSHWACRYMGQLCADVFDLWSHIL